jgi:hypothetical protein
MSVVKARVRERNKKKITGSYIELRCKRMMKIENRFVI